MCPDSMTVVNFHMEDSGGDGGTMTTLFSLNMENDGDGIPGDGIPGEGKPGDLGPMVEYCGDGRPGDNNAGGTDEPLFTAWRLDLER